MASGAVRTRIKSPRPYGERYSTAANRPGKYVRKNRLDLKKVAKLRFAGPPVLDAPTVSRKTARGNSVAQNVL